MIENILSISGGKDSTAMTLLAIERETENLSAVFADTGHEHEQTYDYIDYLQSKTGIAITRVKADFSEQLAKKRTRIQKVWSNTNPTFSDVLMFENMDAGQPFPEELLYEALEILQPTGIPFLDLCLWKGRFPSAKARFCSEELKIFPIQQQVYYPILKETASNINSWQGIRWAESPARAKAVEFEGIEPDATRVFAVRPILSWSADDVFEMHRRHGLKWNPLYEQEMGRVGCMPCVNCRKSELNEIARRFPEVIDRLRRWEDLVSKVSRRRSSTFFPAVNDPMTDRLSQVTHTEHGIDRMTDWAKTTRGGRQFDLITPISDTNSCSSMYGLCG
jgi:3'-phosphoadenosine 5'-phosphosulfate sulfotransferase (PAPS reductase)/FAD synthetase